MAERKSKRRRKDLDEKVEPSKEETEIGKHLRWNCPVKNSTIMGQKVEYFIASKAVDCLLDSKWASGKGGTEIRFTDRASVVTYLQRLLELEFFYRVHRIKKKKGEGKEKEKGKGKEKEKEPEKGKGKEREVERETEKTKEDTDGKKSKKKEKKSKEEESKNKDEAEGKKKRKVKVKLEMHEEQIFLDGDDQAYAWIFDPVHPKTFIMGILVVIASIAICMFPLWPMNVREYVWYLSVAGAVAIGLLLLLGVVRYVMFSVLWALSLGKHHFWLLPNLYAECGFFESFVPLYEYEYKGAKEETDKTKSNEKSEKEDEDEEEQNQKQNDSQNENEIENTNEKEKNSDKDKDSSSEDKESTDGGMKDSWVKLTEEEVENARTEVETMEKDMNSSECKEVKC